MFGKVFMGNVQLLFGQYFPATESILFKITHRHGVGMKEFCNILSVSSVLILHSSDYRTGLTWKSKLENWPLFKKIKVLVFINGINRVMATPYVSEHRQGMCMFYLHNQKSAFTARHLYGCHSLWFYRCRLPSEGLWIPIKVDSASIRRTYTWYHCMQGAMLPVEEG